MPWASKKRKWFAFWISRTWQSPSRRRGRYGDRLDYYAGIYDGSPVRQFTAIAGNDVVEGRLTVNPMGKVDNSEFGYVLGNAPPARISLHLAWANPSTTVGGDRSVGGEVQFTIYIAPPTLRR